MFIFHPLFFIHSFIQAIILLFTHAGSKNTV